MQPSHVTAFQEAILAGNWTHALQHLPQLASDASTLAQARFWVLRQKYVEAIEAGDTGAALQTLRSELAPLQVQQAELRVLAGEACCSLCLRQSTPQVRQLQGYCQSAWLALVGDV